MHGRKNKNLAKSGGTTNSLVLLGGSTCEEMIGLLVLTRFRCMRHLWCVFCSLYGCRQYTPR